MAANPVIREGDSFFVVDPTTGVRQPADSMGNILPPNPNAGATTQPGSTANPILNASDFASWSGLPDWGSSAVQRATDSYADPVFANYQSSIDALGQAPANTETARKASESQFLDTTQKNLAESSRQANVALSANGTADSSVGTDYVAALANNAIAAAQQQQGVNVAAQEADYQNLVDTAGATQGFSSTIGGLIGNSKETFNPNYPGLDFDPGPVQPLTNQDGNGTWSPDTGLDFGATYGNHYSDIMGPHWEPPPEFKDLGGGEYSYGGQKVSYNTQTGQITDLSSSEGDPPLLNSADMASRAALEGFASATTQGLVDTYSDPAMANAYSATAALQAAGQPDGQIEADAEGLNQQYGTLSAETMAMLNSAMATAGVTGATAAPSTLAANQAAINNAAQAGTNTIANQTAAWQAGMQNKNLTDSAAANQDMAKIIGDYLGLARYSYDPNYDKYLEYSKA